MAMFMFPSMLSFFGLLVIFVDLVEDVACGKNLQTAKDDHFSA